MKRLFLTTLLVLLGSAVPAFAGDIEAEGDLRNWYLMLQMGNTWRSEREVFGDISLDVEVDDASDGGMGLVLGRRFGDRFLLGLQVTAFRHQVSGSEQKMVDLDALITGTVLFRERDTLQPFVRGGFGGSGQVLDYPDDGGNLTAFGAGAIAGGGLQILFNRRFSFELEGVFTFSNYLQVEDSRSAGEGGEDGSWQVRTSAWGTRIGLGLCLWF